MNNRGTYWQWGAVAGLVALSIIAIWPPERKLKGGIDLVGGTSLLFEIDSSGMTSREQTGLAGRVMDVLKRRVDPNAQLNLVWRPIGNTRLEIQMPRPSQEALQLRKNYESSLDLVKAINITHNDLENALNTTEGTVEAALKALEGALAPAQADALLAHFPDEPAGTRETLKKALTAGVPGRATLLLDCKSKFEQYQAVRGGDDLEAEAKAQAAYEASVDEVLKTNLDVHVLQDTLELENKKERTKVLDDMYTRFPAYAPLIRNSLAAYESWSGRKGLLEDPSDLKRRIKGAGVLEFRILAERDPANPGMIAATQPQYRQGVAEYLKQLAERGPRWKPGEAFRWIKIMDIVGFLNLDNIDDYESRKNSASVITEKYAGSYYVLAYADPNMGLLNNRERPWKLVDAAPSRDSNTMRPSVVFALDARGANMFGDLTSNNLQKPMAIVLDDTAQSFATIMSRISDSGQISGGSFTQQDVNELVSTLEAGSLPARLKDTPLAEKNIGPSLGKRNREMGMNAAIGGIAVTVVFMLVYYRLSGVMANIALFMNVLMTLGIMATLEATFTLPGIAGLILSLGMAVDANVLINERIREERERGTPLRKAVRLGYEKAFSAILDANLTTLLTCVILGYVGSEEVKGFAMVLGFGLATSMFTAVWVTRWMITPMVENGWVKEIKMMKLVGVPTIDWIALRRIFWPVSLAVCVGGLALFVFVAVRTPSSIFDIEFLGGTAVQVEMKPGITKTDEDVRDAVAGTTGFNGKPSASQWLRAAADELEKGVTVESAGPNEFRLTAKSLTAEQLAALVRSNLEHDALERDGLSPAGSSLIARVRADAKLDVAGFKARLANAAERARSASTNLTGARVQTVEEINASGTSVAAFEIVTVETNREMVQTAIMAALGDSLQVDRSIQFNVVKDEKRAPEGYFPIEEGDRYLDDVFGSAAPDAHFDIKRYTGGVALLFDDLNPPQSEGQIKQRLREIRLQPEFENYQLRDYMVKGLSAAGMEGKEPTYKRFALVVVDENVPYGDDPRRWEDSLAKVELDQAQQALRSEKSLQKVIQFAPQVAGQARNQAFVALLLALVAIVGYVWVRFGSMQFGLAAIVALVHDVIVALAALAIGHRYFKIDMNVVAALLTLVGFSINDTIVIFDRIREMRGKSGTLNPNLINGAINSTMSRTVLTTGTVLLTLLIMFFWGGDGIHGFAYAMLVGCISGTYSTVAIAAPLVYLPRTLSVIIYVLCGVGVWVMLAMMDVSSAFLIGSGVVVMAAVLYMTYRRLHRPEATVRGLATA